MPIVVLGGSGGAAAPPETLPGPVTNFTASKTGNNISLSWTNPTSYFTGVMIRMKVGSVVNGVSDGVEIYNGAGASFLFTPSGDNTYYFRAFPYNSASQYQTIVNGQSISIEYVGYKVYGVRIDTTNPDPEACCVYTDDAVGMSPSLGNNGNFIDNGWDNTDIFKALRPCLLKNGEVVGYLQKNDFSKFEDGTTADVSVASGNNVMIEIPTMAYMIYTEGNYIYVKIVLGLGAEKIDSRFVYYAHQTPDVPVEHGNSLYIGVYNGYSANNVLRSIPNVVPTDRVSTTSSTYGVYQSHAKNNGSGYSVWSFYPFTLLQCLYLIRYKNLNSQLALGTGSWAVGILTAGSTNTLGMNYGSNSGSLAIKCNGIENMWGNIPVMLDGFMMDSNYNVLTSFGDFNSGGIGYTNVGKFISNPLDLFMRTPVGNNECGFIARNITGGSDSTYYCDRVFLNPTAFPQVGGNSKDVGIFYFSNTLLFSSKFSGLNARLQYIKNVK